MTCLSETCGASGLNSFSILLENLNGTLGCAIARRWLFLVGRSREWTRTPVAGGTAGGQSVGSAPLAAPAIPSPSQGRDSQCNAEGRLRRCPDGLGQPGEVFPPTNPVSSAVVFEHSAHNRPERFPITSLNRRALAPRVEYHGRWALIALS